MAAITDWVSSLSRHGFERIYFLNGHGGNVATIEATFSEIYAEWSSVEERAAVRPEAEELVGPAGRHSLCNQIFPTGHGMHATPSEIAVTQGPIPTGSRRPNMSPEDRAQRTDPRRPGLSRPLPGRPDRLGPGPGQPREGPADHRSGGSGPAG
jgi:creatinine amidohydrolase